MRWEGTPVVLAGGQPVLAPACDLLGWVAGCWASCLQSCSRLRPGLDPSLAAATRLHNLTTVTQVTLLHRYQHSDIQLGWGNLVRNNIIPESCSFYCN